MKGTNMEKETNNFDNPLQRKTPKGYEPYELISGLQKFIRRSLEKEALFCFYELEAHGLFHFAKSRLKIIVYEDVGIANMELLNSINGHISAMEKFHKSGNGAWRLVLGNIILMACRGKKTRTSDQFVCAIAAKIINGWRVNFDEHDFVYDMHTRKGKSMGRGYQHFYDHASKIIESKETTDYYQEEIDESNIAEDNGFNVLEDYTKSNAALNVRQEKMF